MAAVVVPPIVAADADDAVAGLRCHIESAPVWSIGEELAGKGFAMYFSLQNLYPWAELVLVRVKGQLVLLCAASVTTCLG